MRFFKPLTLAWSVLCLCLLALTALPQGAEAKGDDTQVKAKTAQVNPHGTRARQTGKTAQVNPHGTRALQMASGEENAQTSDDSKQGASPHGSHGAHQSRWAIALFWLLAFMTMGGGLFVITRHNLVSAVIGMIGTFFGIAGLFLMLYAGFLAAMQVLVYAGAIMVLFVFVIMILNREEEEPWAVQGLLGKGFAGIGLAYLFIRLSKVLWSFKDLKHHLPAPIPFADKVGTEPVAYAFGSVKGVGNTLFSQYLFPFEAVSLVLLVAVVGAIAVARPHESSKRTRGVSP